MAWFFHTVVSAADSAGLARRVVEDHADGFSYLPVRDLAVVRDWTDAPYLSGSDPGNTF